MKSDDTFKWTLKSLFALVAIVAVHVAIIRAATPALACLGGFGWSIAAVVMTRRCGLHPFLTAVAAIVAATVATSIVFAAAIAQTAFAPRPPNVLMWGGGWSTVVMVGLIGGVAGFIIGVFVAMMYLAASIPRSLVNRD